MGRILRTPRANDDLLDIWEYIARDNLTAADQVLHRIDEACRNLSDHPRMGQLQEPYRPGLRSFSVGSYVIFYHAIDNGIEVYRVLHGARYFEDLL